MSKSKLSNYKYQGALASLSSSVKKVLDIDGRFIDASKVDVAPKVAFCPKSLFTFSSHSLMTIYKRSLRVGFGAGRLVFV
jgi:hypothetical protein